MKVTCCVVLLHLILVFEMIQPGCKEQDILPPPPPGPAWRVFHKSDTTLLDNKINAITVALDGRVWISTDLGASYFQRGSWGWVRDSLYGYRVNSIVEAKDRSIWFCLSGGGVMRYRPFALSGAIWQRFTEPDLIYDVVNSSAADRSARTQYGELWFTSVFGISRFVQTSTESGSWFKYSQNDSGQHVSQFPTNSFLVALTKPDDNTIWFGAEKGGAVFVTYGLANLQWNVLGPLFGDPRVISIGFDLFQHVWIGRDAGGVSTIDFKTYTWTEYNSETTNGIIPGGRINAIVTDHQQIRWFGTDSGLVRFNNTTWTKYTTENSRLPSNTITALCYDVRGNLWVGTADGIIVYNENGVEF